ncbi:hypothetical protein POZ03_16770 [Bacteroides uniformis]|uniref:hypothetical protein n=1 Tax=Bacteroides uniformis TaxID=820 RepID=UPI00233F0B5E|nr:hypothetical protein [Bacteroides uniformis]MDC1812114.1 hypothetical protein [Bacteroides uniformis]
MQEHENDMENMSVENLFLNVQESYEEAQARAAEENKTFAKTEFFRMDRMGTYHLRILPLAPTADGQIERKSYQYPVHQLILEIEKPSTNGKQQFAYATVTRAIDAGYSLDIIDTYRKLSVDAAKEAGNEKLAEKIAGGSFGGGLKFSYSHAMYILNLDERAKGIQLLTLSHSQFKELDDRRFKLWQKKLAKNQAYPCPISSIRDAYPIEVEKKKNGSKTEYLINIDNESEPDILSKEELTLLLNTPRIPEVTLRYSRYQFEATLEFLKQCDIKYGLQIMQLPDMLEAIETLRAELPKDDISTFSFDKRTKDAKDNATTNALSLDFLYERFEELQEQSLGDKTEEGQELRGMIRSYIEQEKLPVRVTRSTTNQMLLDMVEEALHNDNGASEDKPAPENPPRRK